MKKLLTCVLCFSILNGMNQQNIDTAHTLHEQNEKKLYNLILDLDGVILHHPAIKKTSWHQFYENKSFLIQDSYNKNYVVPAYLTEFLKFATSTFNVSFFSAACEDRNKSVIQNIWKKVFNQELPEYIRICSRHHLSSFEPDDDVQPFGGGDWFYLEKKDITIIGDLQNTILVDDSLRWILKDQVRNFLKAPEHDFYNLQNMIEFYSSNKNYAEKVDELLSEDDAHELLAFYKLVYIAGVLDHATENETNLIDELYAIQYEDDKPKFYDRIKELTYYKRGYRVLSNYATGKLSEHFPEIERYFHY